MLEELLILLGDSADNYTNAQISLCLKMAIAEIEGYCGRKLYEEEDEELELIACRIAIIKLNRLNTEGLSSQSYSGVSESYVNGYPNDIMAVLKRKRKIKVI